MPAGFGRGVNGGRGGVGPRIVACCILTRSLLLPLALKTPPPSFCLGDPFTVADSSPFGRRAAAEANYLRGTLLPLQHPIDQIHTHAQTFVLKLLDAGSCGVTISAEMEITEEICLPGGAACRIFALACRFTKK